MSYPIKVRCPECHQEINLEGRHPFPARQATLVLIRQDGTQAFMRPDGTARECETPMDHGRKSDNLDREWLQLAPFDRGLLLLNAGLQLWLALSCSILIGLGLAG